MKLRFLGAESAYVTPLGRTVEPDESIDVDDSLVWRAATRDDDGTVTDEGNETGYVWPEDLWAEVGSGRRRQVAVQDEPKTAPGTAAEDDTTTSKE
jgi:hypothetical protein